MSLASAVGSALPWRAREFGHLHTAIRVRHPMTTRVGVVGVARGIGTSVSAGLAASILAAHGGHRVLAVNASSSGRSVLWHAGQPPQEPSTPEDDEHRSGATRFAEAVAGIPRAASGVYCLELAEPAVERWNHAVAPIGRFFDYAITDWGYRERGGVGPVVHASTLTCVVAPADRAAVQLAVDLAGAAEEAGSRPILVITDPTRSWGPAWREIQDLLPFPATHIAHDGSHGESTPRSSRRLSPGTRLSGLRLAATITRTATEGRRR